MAISIVNEITHGTFEEVMEQVRKLHDTNGIVGITVSFKKEKKPRVKLEIIREDYEQNE